ncbi:Dematin Dematin actin-binding protein [Takifugu flavidus]|uniref:Dematin Dematin actin-binding protein n=1 Tax=Takifugu flavidus TaxID=433684 RepID=A0A5C6N2C8_9TELE|nr:Dematin Dematin actin-binding protein [Takifugu flavidus]
MMTKKQLAQTSPGSVLSLRGSPAAIVVRVEDGVIGYKDLAALPQDKAILDIERPDLMMYQPHFSYSPAELSLSLSREGMAGVPFSWRFFTWFQHSDLHNAQLTHTTHITHSEIPPNTLLSY